MSAGNLVNIPRLPDEKQLAGEENWRPFKREISFAVQSRGLTGYMDGTIPKLTPRTQDYPGPIYPMMATPPYSPTPHPEEWELRDRLVAGAIVSNIVDPIGLGVDETKRASEIWQNLIKRFEKRDEQQIHLAETSLRREVFDPSTDTMESHEKKMQNLLKRMLNSEGSSYSQCLRSGDKMFAQSPATRAPTPLRICRHSGIRGKKNGRRRSAIPKG
ncbi:hypothetical protein EV359DRAFT_68966 [Lentinula novae-zelandiae]|nr:hypothetical protein EV359DRAFT_68966 [Lentinula novae-zelandiae]